MIATKQAAQPRRRSRYPGVRPFSDSREDQQIFFGRDADIDRLFERVLVTRLLVLFGKSGLGKTSLLMAGLFPRFNKKPLLPVPIRLNRPGTPTEIVLAAVAEASARQGAELNIGDAGGIWELLRTSLIWKGDLLATPVLVFDQFEEIFTLHDAEFRIALAAELGALASGTPPERLRASARHSAEPGARLGEKAPEVKILLSLREEYLGTLQELSSAIPGLFQERIRLEPLGEKEAREAICRPAEFVEEPGDNPFNTPRFKYENDALDEMLAYLRGKSHIIEPFQLQLLCCRAEEIIENRAKEVSIAKIAEQRIEQQEKPTAAEFLEGQPAIHITCADLGGLPGMEGVLSQFYYRVINMLNLGDRRRARRLCEEGLLSANGRRLMLDQAQIESEYKLSVAALTTLMNEHLLRCEPHLESLFYEISHDRVAESIEHHRPFRIPKKLRSIMTGAAAVAILTIGALFWWNGKIERAKKAAERARSDAEGVVAALIGESFLDQLRPVGRNIILEDVQNIVQRYLDKSPGSREPGQMRTRGLAARNAGDILQSRGKLSEAVEKFCESAGLFESWADAEPESLVPKAERARALEKLGDAIHDQGKISESLETHLEALALRQAVYDGGNRDTDSIIELANSESSVGRMLNKMGRPRQALAHLDRARDLLQPIEKVESRSPLLLEALHEATDNRADSLGLIGDQLGSQNAYISALTITEEWLKSQPLSADARVRQATAVSRLANMQRSQGALQDALEQYQKINRAFDELTRWDDTNLQWRRDFGATLLLIAAAQKEMDNFQEALDIHSRVENIFNELAKTDRSNISLKDDISWFYRSRGALAIKQQKWDDAIQDFTTAKQNIEEAGKADEACVSWLYDECIVLFELAFAYQGAGKIEEAAASYRRGQDTLLASIKAAPEAAQWLSDRFYFLERELRMLRSFGRMKEAEAVAREKDQAYESATAALASNVTLLNESSIDDFRDGDKAKSAGRLDDALAAYRKGLKKASQATELEPGNATLWSNLRYDYEQIGDVFYEAKRWADAEKAFRDGLGPGEKAFSISPHRAELASQLSKLQVSIGNALEAGDEKKLAIGEFERALEWLDKAIEIDKDSGGFFNDRRAICVRIAEIKADLSDVDGAQKAYIAGAEAGSRAVELAAATDKKAEFANALYLLYVKQADWYDARTDYPAALRDYDAARPWIEKAIGFAPGKSVYVCNLSILHTGIGRTKFKLKDLAGAEFEFRASVDNAERSAQVASKEEGKLEQADRENDLHVAHEAYAEFLLNRGDSEGALAAHGFALTALKRAAELDAKNARYLDSMANIYRLSARIKEESKNAAGAEADLRAGAEAGQQAAALDKSAIYLNQAGVKLYSLANFYERSGFVDKAMLEYSRAASQIESAHGLDAKNAQYLQNLSICRRTIGNLREKADDAANAGNDFETAVRAARLATELAPNNGENWRALYLAQMYFATNKERRQGDPSETLSLLRDALENAEHAARLLPEDSSVSEDITHLKDRIAKRTPKKR